MLLLGPIGIFGAIDAGGATAQAAELRRFVITIKNRTVDPAQKLVTVTRGDTIELEFTTDEAAELHLHGYDKQIKVEPSALAVLRFDATIAGRFSIEAHGFGSGKSGQRGRSHVVLLYLEVYPR
jgi:hypothetical protein